MEDNAGDRWFYSELLRSRGYSVRSFDTAEGALEAFRADPHPLVLVDQMLPGMDGVEFCRRIRQEPGGWEPVVLAVTGRDDLQSLTEILEAGADDFIRKPVPPSLFAIRLEVAERHIRDRAERRGAAARLDFTAWEMDQLFRTLPEVFFTVDLTEGRLLRISRSAQDLFGIPASELLEHPERWMRLLLPGEESASAWEELARSAPGTRLVRVYPVRHSDGSAVWVRASAATHRDPASGHVRAHGVVVDVTDEWEARTALARSNRELAALYQVSELTLTSDSHEDAYREILDVGARILEVPVVLLEQLDRSGDRLVVVAAHGLPLAEDAPLEIPLHQTPAGAAVQTGRPLVDTDPRTRRDLAHGALRALGARFWASFPLRVGGAVTGTLTVVDQVPRDVDQRWTQLGVRVAMALAAYMEHVEAEAALRESDTRHRTLAAQLGQANQELESFAYSVSHDLRAPLRTMQGFAHALLRDHGDGLAEEARDYVRRIIASGRRSEQLITDLLAYSRLSFEKIEVKPVDLGEMLSQVLETMQADIAARGAKVRVQGQLPVVLGNPTTMLQVLSNLISNAVKFVPPERGPEVTLRAEERGDYVRLWVEDNGIGIPEGQEERIFRVFERLAEGGEPGGTGIGLAIVRRGIERVGGRCGVEPIPGGGSGFWIELLQERRQARRTWSRRLRGG